MVSTTNKEQYSIIIFDLLLLNMRILRSALAFGCILLARSHESKGTEEQGGRLPEDSPSLRWGRDKEDSVVVDSAKQQMDDDILTWNLGDKQGAIMVVDMKTGAASINLKPQSHPNNAWFHLLGGLSVIAEGEFHLNSSSLEESLEHHIFGSYSKASFMWSSNTSIQSIETSYLVFADHEMVIFDQYFSSGWENPREDGSDRGIVAPFPSVNLSSVPSSSSSIGADDGISESTSDNFCLGYLLWGDCFLSDTQSGDWADLSTQDWGRLFDGDTYGQPWVLHDETGRTSVWSSLSNFFVSGAAAALTDNNSTLEFGLRATLESIPKDFHHSAIMVAGYGINSTLMEWGDRLLEYGESGKARANVYDDFLLAHLGYWTDNGAFHYRGVHPDHANMEEALLAVKNGLIHDQGVPIRYIQWDDWWMESKGDIPGMLSWEPKPEVFPSGFSNWLDLPLAMYAPEYSGENVWMKDYHWKTAQIPRGSTAIPLDPDFYMDLFRNGTEIGMIMFEQDFLCSYGIGGSRLTSTDVNSGATWLKYMDRAAHQYGIKLQFCMPDAYHLLESTKIRSVTNARATGDNTRSYRSISSMGQNGLLFYALGVFASRDNVWTSNADIEQTGCGNQDFCFEANAHLDNVVAVLSGGPYGIADKLGYTNKTLAMYACRSDGLMLRSRWPLAALDFTFTDITAKGSKIWAAHDTFGAFRWSYIVGVDLEDGLIITPSRLIQASVKVHPQSMVAWEVAVGSPISTVTTFSDEDPFHLPKSRPLNLSYDVHASTHTHIATAPVLPNGMVILGEQKWATMSFGRVLGVDASKSSVTIRLVGAPSEEVKLAYLLEPPKSPKDTKPHIVKCTFPTASSCQEYDQHGNQQCRLWIVCQLVNGCTCSNGSDVQAYLRY